MAVVSQADVEISFGFSRPQAEEQILGEGSRNDAERWFGHILSTGCCGIFQMASLFPTPSGPKRILDKFKYALHSQALVIGSHYWLIEKMVVEVQWV